MKKLSKICRANTAVYCLCLPVNWPYQLLFFCNLVLIACFLLKTHSQIHSYSTSQLDNLYSPKPLLIWLKFYIYIFERSFLAILTSYFYYLNCLKCELLENLPPSVFLSALTAAAGSGKLAVCRLLLDQGAAVDQGNKQGVAPLFSAVRHDHWKVGQNPENTKTHTRKLRLNIMFQFDSCFGHVESHFPSVSFCQVVELLLNHGVEVNMVDQQGRTAVMTAASEGHLTTGQLLLDHGNHPSIDDDKGLTITA